MHVAHARLLAFCALATPISCASGPEVTKEGLPVWVDQPCSGLDAATTLCAVGESDFAAADVEAAKTDAETAAKNRIAEQLQAKNGRLVERLSSAMKDLANGRTYGERTVKDINRNFSETTLTGLRFDAYHFIPDRLSPQRVFVRALLSVDTNKMAQDISAAMLSSAAQDRLEFKHEEAQQRFDAVRRQYLEEEGGKAAQ